MSSVTIKEPVFDEGREHPGFKCLRARIGRQAGSKKVGASLWELPEGQTAYPYHWHVAEEELLIVLDGAPSLRTPDGWRELDEGEVVSFPCKLDTRVSDIHHTLVGSMSEGSNR